MTEAVLTLWTVYDHPHDFPRHVVVRAHAIPLGVASVGCLYDTLNEARAWCRTRGLTCIPRDPDDDEVIVETWL